MLSTNELFKQAVLAHKGGATIKASALYSKVILAEATHAHANHNLGVLLVSEGKVQQALNCFKTAIESNPNVGQFWASYIDALLRMGQHSEAKKRLVQARVKGANGAVFDDLEKRCSQPVLNDPPSSECQALIDLFGNGKVKQALNQTLRMQKAFPKSVVLCNIAGACHAGLRQFEAAVNCYKKALKIMPDYAQAHFNMGAAYQAMGDHDRGIGCYQSAIKIDPNYADAYNNMGNAFKDKGELLEAIKSYKKAVIIKPDYAESFCNMGVAFQENGDLKSALVSYRQALSLKPNFAEAHNNLGKALLDSGEFDSAIASYKRAIDVRPNYAEAYSNLGVTYKSRGDIALAMRYCTLAIEKNSGYAEAYNNLANVLRLKGDANGAIANYKKCLKLKPEYSEAYCNLGLVFRDQGDFPAAIMNFKRAIAIKPSNVNARSQMLFSQLHICDWSNIETDNTLISELGVSTLAIGPFTMLALDDSPERHLIRSKNYVATKYRPPSARDSMRPQKSGQRIRIGYFSADFHNHATMYLMIKVLESHDRNLFEIYAYSFGPNASDDMRARLVKAVDVFHEVSGKNDQEVSMLARADNIDIAVDLKGFTRDSRFGIFTYRPAPVQIAHLGYPGTSGADCIDYIIADDVVIPKQFEDSYSEHIIRLPHSYQPNDDDKVISDINVTKVQLGLPEKGFIFCCFNKSYKISPKELDVWARVLKKVEGSVLWLIKPNKWVESNLRNEAKKRGIEPHRLVFAERVSLADHLARHKFADLFIDTFNCNAHTTASDALWVGLPVVTMLGKSFAARVAGSLLTAIDLPELITTDVQEYEELITTLAKNPEALKKIREKLVENKLTKPLFDTKKFTQHLETGYTQAFEKYKNGEPPENIVVFNG